jgi:3-deoxy-D-manno-octulosonic-acid transferase
LPLDFPLALDRLFRLMRPRALAIVETELWPGLIATAVRREVPVFLINAKIPPADFPRYRATKALWRPILQRCHAILAASPVDRDRFLACGAPPARVTVAGDTKYDAALQASAPGPTGPLASLFARRPPDRLLVLLASTHSGEEDLLLRALRPLGARVQFVVAPRHVERADAVAAVLTRLGMSFERREPGHLTWSCDAVLWDTVGELAGLYAFSDLVVMGGSWKPCGGHNPLEPAAWVKPIVVGPHMENFHDTLADLTSCEALVTTTAEGLPAAVRRLLDDPAWRTQLGRRARARVEARAGAAGLCAAAIRRVLPATPTIQAERPVRRPRWARGRRGFRGFACWIAVGCCG